MAGQSICCHAGAGGAALFREFYLQKQTEQEGETVSKGQHAVEDSLGQISRSNRRIQLQGGRLGGEPGQVHDWQMSR